MYSALITVQTALKNLFGAMKDAARSFFAAAMSSYLKDHSVTVYRRYPKKDLTFPMSRALDAKSTKKVLKYYFKNDDVWCVEVNGKPHFRKGSI